MKKSRQMVLIGCIGIACMMADSQSCDASIHYYGTGRNTTFGLDFNVQIILSIEGDVAKGHFNATEAPGEPTICGKGDFVGSIAANEISFAFVSADDDPGCGASPFTLESTAMILEDGSVLSGNYTVNGSASEGIWMAYRGVSYAGTGINLTFDDPWVGTMSFAEIPNEGGIVGFFDADGLEGGTTICGSGIFTGQQTDNSLSMTFISNDTDPGCGFEFGRIFDFVGVYSNRNSFLAGSYTIDEPAQEGTFAFERILFADDFEIGSLACWSRIVADDEL